jgi:hypothetical protein
MPEPSPSETRRKEIFLALVEAQDVGLPVGESRKVIAQRFDLTVRQVQGIEQEGLDREWPPLAGGGLVPAES